MARIRGVEVSINLWQEITTKGWHTDPDFVLTCENGLPEGAELVNSFYDGRRRTVVLVFHHESFPDIAIGSELYIQPVEYRQVHRDEWTEGDA